MERLAIDGATPAFPDGPPPWPGELLPRDVVANTLQSLAEDGSWAKYHAEHTDKLIECVAQLTNQPHVRLASSGTIAVEMALRGLGIGSGKKVVLGAYDFPGNFRAIESTEARPVIVDIDSQSGCVELPQIEAAAKETDIDCVIVSHLHGGLAGMKSIMEWAADHSVAIVEDACQAPGALVDGQAAGSWGDASVLSFGGSKLLTSGRGGAVACRQPETLQRINIWADRGNDAYPLSQLQAAVLPFQFDRLIEVNARRRASATRIFQSLNGNDGLRIIWNQRAPDHLPSAYKLGFCLDSQTFDSSQSKRWMLAAQHEGIAIAEGFRGFTKRSERRCDRIGPFPNAEVASQGLVLHHPILLQPDDQIDLLIETLRRITKATKNTTPD